MESKYYFYAQQFPKVTVVHKGKRFLFFNHLYITSNEEDVEILKDSPHYGKVFILKGVDDRLAKIKEKYPDMPEEVLEDEKMLKYFKMESKALRKKYREDTGKDYVIEGKKLKDVYIHYYNIENGIEENKEDE